EVRIVEEIPKYGNSIKFRSSCEGRICRVVGKKRGLKREYIIKLEPNSQYRFFTQYEILY
ncbi:MAG: hypothetical protein GXN91_02605, partial [Epsilonproteobacteria bacterium]|nr:hypothetical protein [Campylobacterota bacterium]